MKFISTIIGGRVISRADHRPAIVAGIAGILAVAGAAWSSAQEYLVKDINSLQETTGASPSQFAHVNDSIFFFKANDGMHGTELWKSDGTADGTVLVADISPAGTSADPASLTFMNGTLFFTASDGVHGRELWKSDGTAAGTQMVMDINTGTGDSTPINLMACGSTLYFSAYDAANRGSLWKTDGSAEGTTLLKSIGATNSSLRNFTVSGGTLYFAADDLISGMELWKSDGMPDGTMMVSDINPGASGSNPSSIVGFDGGVLFSASNGSSNTELWRSDGTSAGTVMIKDINPGTLSSNPQNLTPVGNLVLFSAITTNSGIELWRTDGTSAGTLLLKDINFGSNSSYPSNFVSANGVLYFVASSPANGSELWRSDGSSSGTRLVKDILAGISSSRPQNLLAINDSLFFTAMTSTNGYELWKSDGTTNGTVMVKDIRPGASSSLPQYLANINGTLVFSADDGINGRELWSSDGTDAGTRMISNIRNSTADSLPGNLVSANGVVFLVASNGTSGNQLWRSDGTEAGTFVLTSVAPNTPSSVTRVGDAVYFSAGDTLRGRELWKSDGTLAGTMMVRDINTSGMWGSYPTNLVDVDGILMFAASDDTNAAQLWKSDGTYAGTVKVKQLMRQNGYLKNAAQNLVNVNGTLFFSFNDPVNGTAIWKSDGTDAGTLMVRAFGQALTRSFVNVDGTLFFVCSNAYLPAQLWKSDGTDEGTIPLTFSMETNAGPQNLVCHDHRLFFTYSDYGLGQELWQSDGTPEGTTLVKDICFGPDGSAPSGLVAMGNRLFFSANDGEHGYELWQSDGTDAGTTMVTDIAPGSSSPQNLACINGLLFFSATDGINGRELWMSDGTAGGTGMVGDITGDSLSSSPLSLTQAGDLLFFSAQSPIYGRELFAYHLPSPPVVVGFIPDQIGTNGMAFYMNVPPDLFYADGRELTLSMKDLPPGIEFDAEYNVMTGSFTSAGVFAVTLLATDNSGPVPSSASLTFNIIVARAVPALTWDYPADIVYGTMLDERQLNATAPVPGTIIYNPPVGTLLNAGDGQWLSASFIPDDTQNYTPVNSTVLINVSRATPVLTWATPEDVVYGTALGDGKLNATANVPGTFAYEPPAGTVLNAGGGQILAATFVPADSANYNTTQTSVMIGVQKAVLTATAENTTRSYGSANPALNVSFTGFVLGETTEALGTLPVATTVADLLSPVGAYAIELTGGSARNYDIHLVNGTMEITPALLSVTAASASRIYGEPDPAFSGTITGLKNNDNITATYSCQADASSLAGEYDIVPALVDPDGRKSNYDVTLTRAVLTVTPAPLAVQITSPASGHVHPVSSNLVFTGTFTRSGASDTYSACWIFSYEGEPFFEVPAVVSNGIATCSVSFTSPGLYGVALTVTNASGPSAMADTVNGELPASVVIYDSQGGFVTAGGWIMSPQGSCVTAPTQSGKSTLGLNVKYQPGATVPSGQTQFKFGAADLDFRATSHDWLIVSDASAQFKGSGTINGEGDYGFIVTLIDGKIAGTTRNDLFRMKIWEKEHGITVYDNQPGAPESANPTSVVQGSVVIHKQ